MKYLPIFVILVSSILNGQIERLRVVEVLDANLFKLENGALVRMGDLQAASILDSNPKYKELAFDALNYALISIKGKEFNFDFSNNQNLVISEQELHIKMLLNEIDYKKEYLKRGYARLDNKSSYEKRMMYEEFENEAKDNKTGIWEYIDHQDLNTTEHLSINEILNLTENETDKYSNYKRKQFFATLSGVFIGGYLGAYISIEIYSSKGPAELVLAIVGGTVVGAVIVAGLFNNLIVDDYFVEKNNNQLSISVLYKDIYNSSKLFDLNVLSINF